MVLQDLTFQPLSYYCSLNEKLKTLSAICTGFHYCRTFLKMEGDLFLMIMVQIVSLWLGGTPLDLSHFNRVFAILC